MPKVLSYTPDWLSRPNPGYQLFAPRRSSGNGSTAKKNTDIGPRKTIATRGSEVFVAVGNELRWADLVNLKEGTEPAYRTLRVSIPLPITRLTISPGGDYLSVSTSHTVHVVHLPDASLLETGDDSPLKPKTFQVGPTIHVREESPIATTLWHPLGYHGRCLVTITKAGVVRLWEVNRADRYTFSEPSLSIDLPKLANATSDQDDLSASKFGASKGFSPDSVELEVASACFGDSPDQEGVHGWAPMTLWIATVPGDVYALCPLLPSKWQLVESPGAFTFLQTLTSSININYTNLSEDDDAPAAEVKTSEKQVAWLADIIYEEPFSEELPNGDSVKVFARPASAPVVPLLQGPFTVIPEVDDFELSDMIVFSLKTLSESSEEEAAEGVPTAVVCLLTDTSKVHVCLDLEGIVGRWLPAPEDDVDVEDFAEHDLVIAETITLVQSEESSYNQSITPDIHTDFSFFVSHSTGVFYISLEHWIRKLENELSEPQTEGSDFRLKRVLDSANTIVEQYLSRPTSGSIAEQEVTSAVVIEDGNVGYLLLTTIASEPAAVLLDAPEEGLPTVDEIAGYMAITGPAKEVREPWQPPRELYEPFDVWNAVNIPSRHRSSLKEEIRLSPANLELLMNVHRVLSVQTSKLQHAVSDLFNRATRLQEEFRDQVYRTSQIASNIDSVTGGNTTSTDIASDDASAYGATHISHRIDRVKTRQEEITARYEALRRKMASINSSELSDKEADWVQELQIIDSTLDPSSRTLSSDVDGSEATPLYERVDKLRRQKEEVVKQAEQAAKTAQKDEAEVAGRGDGVKVPSHTRKAENEVVGELIRRNGVLAEAAVERLRGLGVGVQVV
ncbi:hypothetical protein T440DRAFT_479432 [Plenodomus tracheiphilus IPT5]|uniref:Nucleoporin NUP82 n=1 Tax=Plenodomus tracheiphilus IPT5 TaxID=1408161 RepID=A0A6A7B4D9_9PLEO|nr:hypothetical protein T440DRAFT_479432 [Plenodomus tracheiphilus IPT5]